MNTAYLLPWLTVWHLVEGLIKVIQVLDWSFPESLERGREEWDPFFLAISNFTTTTTHNYKYTSPIKCPCPPRTSFSYWDFHNWRHASLTGSHSSHWVGAMGGRKWKFSGARLPSTLGSRNWAPAFLPQAKEKWLSLCFCPTVSLRLAVTTSDLFPF